jgi:hypothetical protein
LRSSCCAACRHGDDRDYLTLRYIRFTELADFLIVTLYASGSGVFLIRCRIHITMKVNMLKLPERLSSIVTIQRVLLLPIAAASLLGGCYVAPPRPVYVPPPPPPPPAYVAPAPAPPPADAPAVAVEVQASEPPPPLPDYVQPPCPEDGYLWTPGYWGYAPAGYFWVPGTWVAAAERRRAVDAPDTGASARVSMAFMAATGVRTSAFTAA